MRVVALTALPRAVAAGGGGDVPTATLFGSALGV